MLLPGDCAPHFKAASSVNPNFNFDTVAGRYVVLSFFGTTKLPAAERFLNAIATHEDRFDVTNLIFFGVTNDPDDAKILQHTHNGRIFFYDLDGAVSRLYQVLTERPADGDASRTVKSLTPTIFVLDQALRVLATFPLVDETDRCITAIFDFVESLPRLPARSTAAPVLIVPYVFEPELCRALIDYYEQKGGEDSGFMRDVDGKTIGVTDHTHKRRMDCEITDERLIRATQERVKRRIVPAIRQAFQFTATRIERHIVACYDAEQGAHFRAHRDNTTLGTAHRRFAITINLNSPEYDGGEIWFPEFSATRYKPPSGAAIVFSCSLLHEVPKVTRGKRYAFLPFLYDDAAAAIRERNRKHLGSLAAAGGAAPTHVCASAATVGESGTPIPVLDGNCGCGNPSGCGTCLSAATYPLEPAPARNTTAATDSSLKPA